MARPSPQPKPADAASAPTPTAMTAPDKNVAIEAYDYGDEERAGFENVTDKDQALPILNLLQSNSRAVKAKRGDIGDLHNSLTDEVYPGKEGVIVVPCTTLREFTEWTPIDNGGGFHGVHKPDSPIVKRAIETSKAFGEYWTEDGKHELVETFNIFGVLCGLEPDEVYGPIMIPFTSTKIKAYKGWIGRINAFQIPQPNNRKITPPMNAHLVRITTQERHERGFDWHVLQLEAAKLSPGGKPDLMASLVAPSDSRFTAAKSMRDVIAKGLFRVDYEAMDRAGGGGGKSAGEGAEHF